VYFFINLLIGKVLLCLKPTRGVMPRKGNTLSDTVNVITFGRKELIGSFVVWFG